jgi:glycerol uptake facilitator-like aquaporin
MQKKLIAEFFGTFWLVFGGCGSAVLAAAFPQAFGFAAIAIGLALTLIHLISIPVTNTSVSRAHSTGPALFVGGWALQQLWLFWVAPLVGGVIGGAIHKSLLAGK